MNGKFNITCAVCAYNAEKYIDNAVLSVIEKFKEIIVINDGSQDETLKILLRYADKIKIINNPSNKGLGFSRNEALKNASFPYVFFMDADCEFPDIDLDSIIIEKNSFTGGHGIEKNIRNSYDIFRKLFFTQKQKKYLSGLCMLLDREKAIEIKFDEKFKKTGKISTLV